MAAADGRPPPLLESLQRELALETAARQALERETVLKTRQLWQLREQRDTEVEQFQEQLSVLRSSLIMAHKQQQQQHAHHQVPRQPSQPSQPSSPRKHPAACGAGPADAGAAAAAAEGGDGSQRPASPSDKDDASPNKSRADQRAAAALEPPPLEQQPGPEQLQDVAGSSEATAAQHLLAAVAKVQQLVEQLTASQPLAAADLSLLQWQLTSLSGSLSATQRSSNASVAVSSSSSASQPCGVLQGVSCHEDPLGARSTAAPPAVPEAAASAAAATQPVCGEGPAAAAAEQQQQQQHCARLAAAAQLFSGAAVLDSSYSCAASLSSSANLLWWYLSVQPGDPPVVRGPYGAGMMIRWLVKDCLDDALCIAGVACPPPSSSRPKPRPPASHASFQPLGQLLAQVQAGRGYVPVPPGSTAAAATAQKARGGRPEQAALPVSTHSCSSAALVDQPRSLGRLASAVSAAAAGGSSSPSAGPPPGVGVLEEAMRWWIDNLAAASFQLPGPTSVIDILDKAVSSLTAAATPVHPAVPQASAP